MKIECERFDFAKGTVTRVEREIDSNEVLKGNAFYQMLSQKTKKRAITEQAQPPLRR